jgi:hypothetical protein
VCRDRDREKEKGKGQEKERDILSIKATVCAHARNAGWVEWGERERERKGKGKRNRDRSIDIRSTPLKTQHTRTHLLLLSDSLAHSVEAALGPDGDEAVVL